MSDPNPWRQDRPVNPTAATAQLLASLNPAAFLISGSRPRLSVCSGLNPRGQLDSSLVHAVSNCSAHTTSWLYQCQDASSSFLHQVFAHISHLCRHLPIYSTENSHATNRVCWPFSVSILLTPDTLAWFANVHRLCSAL